MENLSRKRIALAETRELDLLATMIEREGGVVLRCPLVSIIDAADAAPVEAWLRRVIAGKYEDVVFYTGEGVRRLLGFAVRAHIRDQFIAALRGVRKITRGPKPMKALREVGLSSDLAAENPTTDGLIATLEKQSLDGRRVAVQIYGQTPNERLLGYLTQHKAVVDVVAPYDYASAADDERVTELIAAMAEGKVDAIAFTSSPQYARLVEVAAKNGASAQLKTGLRCTKVVVVGPVMAAELAAHGVRCDVIAEAPFSLKPLVRAIAQALAPAAE